MRSLLPPRLVRLVGHVVAMPVVLLVAVMSFGACMSDDEYSLSAADALRFPSDTIQMDTLVSGQTTPTRRFVIYNPTSKAIRLNEVRLERGTASPFRVNVDGVSIEGGSVGPEAHIEVAAGDSLHVFVFADVPETESDDPVEHTDRLLLTTEGGLQQGVTLSVWGQDVVRLNGAVGVTGDTLLDGRRPYLIADSLVVPRDRTLTIAPGVRLWFSPKAGMTIRGRLEARGTAAQPIVMRGDRQGNMFEGQPYDRIPAQWGGIVITEESYGNHLDHCDIHSGTYGIICDSADVTRVKLRMENSILHNMSQSALTAIASRTEVGNCQISNAGEYCVMLVGGHHSFVHCTIANFYRFGRSGDYAVYYTNEMNGHIQPLEQARFVNTIITGDRSDEIMGVPTALDVDVPFGYRFNHCLLATPPIEDDDNVTECLWDNKDDEHEVWAADNFFPAFDLPHLLFTFTLDKRSQAVGRADAEVTRATYPLDLQGNSRLTDDGPDIGCYERQPNEQDQTDGEE